MKFSNFILMAMLLGSTVTMANVDPKPSTKEISKQLASILGTPNFKLSEDATVANVRFKVTSESEIVVLTVKSENDLVEQYIKSRFNYRKIEIAGLDKGQEYTVDVRVLPH